MNDEPSLYSRGYGFLFWTIGCRTTETSHCIRRKYEKKNWHLNNSEDDKTTPCHHHTKMSMTQRIGVSSQNKHFRGTGYVWHCGVGCTAKHFFKEQMHLVKVQVYLFAHITRISRTRRCGATMDTWGCSDKAWPPANTTQRPLRLTAFRITSGCCPTVQNMPIKSSELHTNKSEVVKVTVNFEDPDYTALEREISSVVQWCMWTKVCCGWYWLQNPSKNKVSSVRHDCFELTKCINKADRTSNCALTQQNKSHVIYSNIPSRSGTFAGL